MNVKGKTFETTWNGRKLTFNTGFTAQQCAGSVMVQYGDTVVLATVGLGDPPERPMGFTPLQVVYQEKYYAAGKIKSSRFIKREGRPSDEAILQGRIIDRSLRPLFPKGWDRETQVMITVLAYDGVTSPALVGAIAASAALRISPVPWNGPLAMSRIGMIDGQPVHNIPMDKLEESTLDLFVAASREAVVMIEAFAKEVTEEQMLKAIDMGRVANAELAKFIEEIGQEIGAEKLEFTPRPVPEQMIEAISKYADQIRASFENADKIGRRDQLRAIRNQGLEENKEALLAAGLDEDTLSFDWGVAFDKHMKGEVRQMILKEEKRFAGRGFTEIRPLTVMAGVLPRVHGSAIFQRGETQGLTITTLGSPGDAQIVDGLDEDQNKKYMHHYNFPPYSVGEVSRRLFVGNREIGHGALAEKALQPMIPSAEEFPYTIRVVTEILQSNGSSSMASVCGSTMSLMDAGVPIKKPVSGVAMGLMTDPDSDRYVILTDLQDEEDMGGDMDFKVAGTKDGITAIQMDIKVTGITMEIFKEALKQAYDGRMKIMEAMLEVLPQPRPELNEYAPKIKTIKIDPDMIRVVIGKGGEMIHKIIDETGVSIDIDDEGLVFIGSTDADKIAAATAWVEKLTYVPKVGDITTGKIVSIKDFGMFVGLGGRDGMVHISEVSQERIATLEGMFELGQEVKVKVIGVDAATGKVSLSMKQV